jgi:predicted SAM-dependent methyltransferase
VSTLKKRLRAGVLSALSLLELRLRPPTAQQLEIGSGAARRAGWLTLDMCRGPDVFWDLRRKLPFVDASFERVYCSHVLEHFSYPDLRRLLLDVLRVLRPGGQFLIAVPNAALYVDAYLGKRQSGDLTRYAPAVISEQRMDVLNYIFYMDGHHRFMFDRDNLAYHCHAAGFVDCALRDFEPGLDAPERDYESLYMVCKKPALG